eukprot:gnl/MRDRNA2_/MRDRNA2_92299_c0_seq1.p1 gnl/MRDRNA2_/MRDRNA2_92299_c0~~gnl/MRDRNA2_/MRDRNA2_92299_c0_seq1.p1  ORF type:complete len:426 (+),score=116.10 gnl/MRDRNA2_/MRDRNA2_92299_c0_seq1:63-1340(+)
MAPVQTIQSLAQWFDAGYAQDDAQKKPLPSGYTGANSDNLFVKARANKVVVWPVRLDLGEMPSDNKSATCTLYHYTHRQSLVACAQIFSQVAEASVKESALLELLKLLKEDCTSRSSLIDSTNLHAGRVLMTSVEPAQFEDSAAIQQEIFGRSISSKDKVQSLSGEQISAKEIGKCCIALRVRKVMCAQLQQTGSQTGVVEMNAERLYREIQKMITSRVIQQKKDEELQQASKKRCFPWPFGRKNDQSRSRSKSKEREEKEALVEPNEAGKEQSLSGPKLKDAQASLIAQKKRAFLVKQANDELMSETKARVQMQNNLDNLIDKVRETKGSSERASRSKSIEASQRKRAGSIAVANSGSRPVKSTKDKLAVDLNAILLADSDSNNSENSLLRAERSEVSATIKTKGSWKQLAKRKSLNCNMEEAA